MSTFQNAVQITRALGLRYLWIDSLCIIQDDKDDWQFESAKMANIYLGSCVTIAATASFDSTGDSSSTDGRLSLEE
ncbi:heterokaryon incompatibility protein [Rutstroemia sp. NJR-2017a BVV2]|nr:heterokaryon incompatibility protein [Rutstroemia sp. NJR-2017a BVV2]